MARGVVSVQHDPGCRYCRRAEEQRGSFTQNVNEAVPMQQDGGKVHINLESATEGTLAGGHMLNVPTQSQQFGSLGATNGDCLREGRNMGTQQICSIWLTVTTRVSGGDYWNLRGSKWVTANINLVARYLGIENHREQSWDPGNSNMECLWG